MAEISVSDLPIRVLPVAAIDAAATAELVNDAFARHAILRGDRTSPAGLLDEAGESAGFLQAVRDGQLVASAMVRPATGVFGGGPGLWKGIDLTAALYFGLAAVHSRERNSGLGRRLVAESERIAVERGLSSVVLGTVREFGLVEYYARLGYLVFAQADFEAGHWNIIVPHRYCHMVKAL